MIVETAATAVVVSRIFGYVRARRDRISDRLRRLWRTMTRSPGRLARLADALVSFLYGAVVLGTVAGIVGGVVWILLLLEAGPEHVLGFGFAVALIYVAWGIGESFRL